MTEFVDRILFKRVKSDEVMGCELNLEYMRPVGLWGSWPIVFPLPLADFNEDLWNFMPPSFKRPLPVLHCRRGDTIIDI